MSCHKCMAYTELSTQIKTIMRWFAPMWGDQAEWEVCRDYWFWDISNYGMKILLYLIVFSWTKLSISLESLVRFWWGFQQNKALGVLSQLTYNYKTQFDSARLKTHFAWLHHTCVPAWLNEVLCSKTDFELYLKMRSKVKVCIFDIYWLFIIPNTIITNMFFN